MDHIACVVVGAGVVGLAVARALAEAGLEVLVLEAEDRYGAGVSSRNSEVVHAGIHHPAGSLKARLCVQGRRQLYAYCEERGIPHRRCGKLVVATRDAELPRLQAILRHAAGCGVALQPLTRDEARAMEPALECRAALWSPDSGIVDSHALMTSLLGDAERGGAVLALRSPFVAAHRDGAGWVLQGGDVDAVELRTDWIVNAAGLGAQDVALRMQGFPADRVPARHLAKGHYFSLAGLAPFTRLIYPTPVDGGLGVHLTLDLAGQARFGPDVQWLPPTPPGQPLDLDVDPHRAAAFEADIRRYWPSLPKSALQPAYSGIRPKLSGPGEPAADFRIDGPSSHGVPGVVQLFGIESPGLTASLAIADTVCAIVRDACTA